MSDTILFAVVASLALPFLSFIFSNSIPSRFAWLVPLCASFLALLTCFASTYVFFRVWNQAPLDFFQGWFTSGQLVSLHIEMSNLNVLMMWVVSVVSLAVHLYSIGYMAGDKNQQRYFGFIGFFTSSMLGVVVAGNLLQLFFFWELMGFASYMLIGHWQERASAAAAAQKAFIMNRIGDAGFLVGLMILWTYAGTLDLDLLVSSSESWSTWAGVCIFLGVIGKSAQFPLFTWLPDAMEGPTPVSALIHAATMVAAGIFILARISFFFTPPVLWLITGVGVVTALAGAVLALVHVDIKKILAYSTISQLGLMVMGVGAGASGASMTHLFTHAFFKASLFLAAGSIIHALHRAHPAEPDIQDIRQMGGLRNQMPFTFIMFVLAAASLSGIPFTSGFLSKDTILTGLPTPLLIFGLLLSALTALYTFRLIWFVFLGSPQQPLAHVTEAPAIMRLAMALLAAGSLWITMSLNPFEIEGWLWRGLDPGHHTGSGLVTVLSALTSLAAVLVSYFLFRSEQFLRPVKTPDGKMWQNNFGLDKLYASTFGTFVTRSSKLTVFMDTHVIDKLIHFLVYAQVTVAYFIGWVDRFFVDGSVHSVTRLVSGVGMVTRSLAAGKIQSYILWSVLTLVIFVMWFILF